MNISKNKNCNIKINDRNISDISAEDMFKKLGFRLISGDDKQIIEYHFNNEIQENTINKIVFNNDFKSYYADSFYNLETTNGIEKRRFITSINMDLLQAINKQCQELGWFD